MNKELEALEEIKNILCEKLTFKRDVEELLNPLQYALERKQKLEKVWEIIKEKNPRSSLIKSMIKINIVGFYFYNCSVFTYEQLTETEFNLLKEMLEEK